MSKFALRAERLSKRYRIGAGEGSYRLSELLYGWGRAAAHRSQRLLGISNRATTSTSSHDYWALKDVSFDVRQGEVVGIIGRNGAGKSTLLKILSRITEPTSGRFGLRGRVASLLEVGTGFHPELTGRENVFLSGSLLGMSRAEISRRFDEIVAFAEIETFLDTPVKRYSSGMYVRLGFAVAAHLQPEILIVDEVLAVGDSAFQEKCLSQMRSAARSGRTVLLVSHNEGTVEALCQRCILLRGGELIADGPPADVIPTYLQPAPRSSGTLCPSPSTTTLGQAPALAYHD